MWMADNIYWGMGFSVDAASCRVVFNEAGCIFYGGERNGQNFYS
jgi:hypothetical protein